MPSSYLYRNRPPGIGCQPDGFDAHETWLPGREVEGRHFLGRVEYSQSLSWEQVKRYELWPEDELERAEMTFTREGKDSAWLREDYLAQSIGKLEAFADRDTKAWAALVILSRQCHLCGEPTAEPGNPLCPACAEEEQERERDARGEKEQKRRPH